MFLESSFMRCLRSIVTFAAHSCVKGQCPTILMECGAKLSLHYSLGLWELSQHAAKSVLENSCVDYIVYKLQGNRLI